MTISIDIACLFFHAPICLIFSCSIGKFPYIYIIGRSSTDFNGSVFPKDVQRFFQVLWIDIYCAFYSTNSPILELYNSHTNIFSFKIVMELLFCYTVYLFNFVSHHPAKKIYSVNALIHETTTIFCPCSSPRSLVIILLATIPTNMN